MEQLANLGFSKPTTQQEEEFSDPKHPKYAEYMERVKESYEEHKRLAGENFMHTPPNATNVGQAKDSVATDVNSLIRSRI